MCDIFKDDKVADTIKNVEIVSFDKSQFLKPIRITFEINGKPKFWDCADTHNSVSILIYNTTRNVVVLVKQFRPAMYITNVPNLKPGLKVDTELYSIGRGYSLELCAGIVDKNCSLVEIARDEVLEECGYNVPIDRFQKLYSFRRVGAETGVSHIYYVEVTDQEKTSKGGGLREEGEFIQVVEITPNDLKKYMDQGDLVSPQGFGVAVLWFFANIKPSL